MRTASKRRASRTVAARASSAPHERSSPKTTRPEAAKRRDAQSNTSTEQKIGRRLDAVPDRIDVRDWPYQPRLVTLPDVLVNCDLVPEILDQGTEGACTGFALAAVINFLLRSLNSPRRVSPQMLYEMARRYDEWPGEAYEGSSARGGMKGWVMHGVVSADTWATDKKGPQHFTPSFAKEARKTPGGAYYRVMHREVRDMHAALNEVGILYATLMVHAGWDDPGPLKRTVRYVQSGLMQEREFPVIRRRGRADGGHAVALVGYSDEGFIIQNSWGTSWGNGGFALLPYEDWLLHATDVWVGQLGVPVALDLWSTVDGADTSAGLQRAASGIPLETIRPYVVDVGNNGELSSTGTYWTTTADLERLFTQEIPDRTAGWSKRRVLLYLHGGLNNEKEVGQRIVAFRDVMLQNEVYPIHIMWESGLAETLQGVLRDLFTDVDDRAGAVADWLKKLRDGLVEAKDRTFELTASLPGGKLWREMKENARLASHHPDSLGGMQLLAKYAKAAMKKLSPQQRQRWELHVVGHSAGSIFAASALPHFLDSGVALKTLQFLAPAVTVQEFKDLMLPSIEAGRCPHPSLFILSDVGERDDDVWAYGKSLLYLVGNAFEQRRETPLLGMERYVSDEGEEKGRFVDTTMRALFKKKVGGFPSLVVAGKSLGDGSKCRSESHGGFDNDPDTMNSVLWRILGHAPHLEFTTRDLQF
jgi:hypothetical protein